jgi:hypothetical protein
VTTSALQLWYEESNVIVSWIAPLAAARVLTILSPEKRYCPELDGAKSFCLEALPAVAEVLANNLPCVLT